MATAQAVVLSSPPGRGLHAPTSPSLTPNAISSSPGLPSLSDILAERMPRPPNQDKAATVSGNTTVSFTSARSLPREKDLSRASNAAMQVEPRNNNDGLDKEYTQADGEKRGKELGLSDPAKVLRKSKSSSTPNLPGTTVGIDHVTNDENIIDSGRKKRIKKPRKDGQARILKAKITKPRSATKTSKQSQNGTTGKNEPTISPRCNTEANIDELKQTSVGHTEPDDLGLTEALQRRKIWTPVKDTARALRRTSDTEAACPALFPTGSSSPIVSADGGLLKRLGEYGFSGDNQVVLPRPHPPRDPNGQAITKKRRLDLIAGTALAAPKVTGTKRSKSPKKKPQTITDKATAPFVLDNQAGASTILNYFPNPEQSMNLNTSGIGQQQDASNKCNAQHDQSRKAKSSKTKAKKKVKETPILHSPESAVRNANSQELLFGTCSQLAREESPTFIRDLQRAVKESEAVDDSQPQLQDQESQLSAKSASSGSSITRLPAAARNLWSVAARNDQGHLLDVDVVDLLDSPRAQSSFSAKPDIPSPEKSNPTKPIAASTSTPVDSDWRTTDNLVAEQETPCSRPNQQEVESALPRSVAEGALRARPKSKSPHKTSSHRTNQQLSTVEGDLFPEMPNYIGYTDVDLKKEVSKTGFKAIRKRDDRISHLEECWRARQSRRALQPQHPHTSTLSTFANANAGSDEATKSSSPAKKRGRPPKKASTLTDGDTAAVTSTTSPKKPRGRPKKGASGSSTNSTLPAKAHSAASLDQQSLETHNEDIWETDHTLPLATSSRRDGPVNALAQNKITANATRTKMTQEIGPLLTTITNAVTTYPPTHNIQNLTPYEKMLLYDPIVLEDFAQWLNNEGLKHVGCDQTVDPTIAKLWCESRSVCCLWRENLRGGTRARY
ncbi:MAG: hypothetical protein Q9168_000440 [Polycauliona sp. 1 TL-2023]